MRLHDEFEWDPAKAERNRAKHGVTFLDAARVLRDDDGSINHVEREDQRHSYGEVRIVTIGTDPADRGILLTICWTDRTAGNVQMTRIISARSANKRERNKYEEVIRGR
jgi:uncharacterized DUF497 family protein